MKTPTKLRISEIDFSKKRETSKLIGEHPYIKEWWNYILAHGKTNRIPSKQQKGNCITAIKYFLQFLSVGPEENKELTLESLVEMGKNRETRKQLETLITYYFSWLRGEGYTPDGYLTKEIPTAKNSAIQYAHSKVRSFFSSREVEFSKDFKTPKKEKSVIRKTDRSSKNQLIRDKKLNYKKLDPFVLKLDYRDQLILSCLLSSGIDIGELLAMKKENLEKIDEFEGRYIYEGKRAKTGEEFFAIFSLRTTELLDIYMNEWRKNIKDSDPVFVSNKFNGFKEITRPKRFGKEENGEMETIEVGQEIKTATISTRFRQVALKLGYVKPGSKKQHAFRPKRFRHLFITLCENSMVSNHAIKQMVGHAEDITDTYKELTLEDLLREYKKVEPFVDIFKSPSVIEHDKDLKMLKDENRSLVIDVKILKEENKSMEERFEQLNEELGKLDIVYLRDENIELKQALTEQMNLTEAFEDLALKFDMLKNPEKYIKEYDANKDLEVEPDKAKTKDFNKNLNKIKKDLELKE